MKLDIKIEGLEQVRRMLDPALVKKAEPRAINKVAQLGRTAESKAIRKVYAITAKRLNREFEKVSGRNKATAAQPRAVLRAKKLTKRNPGLQHFGAKQVLRGVSYKIRKDQGRKTMPHAFKAVMANQEEGVFIRSGAKRVMTKGRYAGQKRQPIIRKTGPSIVQMMERVGIKPIQQAVKNNLPRLFKHEYERELSRAKR